jgi:DNA helicase-2/ATP-dependent DNA helicase PcrA
MVQNNLLDYDDLLILTHKLLTQEASVRTKWQERFKYILVDEFQDTNKMQFDILSLLVNPNTNNVFAVGDPDQTIYTWRGAYPYIFKDYLSKFNNIKQFILNYNYRSTKKILHVSNNVISNNVNRIPKTLSTPNDDGEKVYVYEGKSADDESNYIVSQIKKIVNSGLYSYKEIAILYRQNSLSNNIERHLIDNGIPYYVYGGTRFFQRKEIKDILAYLKLLYDDEDEISIKRVINIPKRGIGMYTIETITKYAQYNNISFGKAIKLSLDLSQDLPWKVNGIVNFFNLIKQMRSETNELSLEDKTKKIIDIIDYNEYLKNLGEDYNERTENVNELINSIALYSTENPENTIKDFIQDISLYTESNANDNSKKDTVSLMTIHVAKGSEYKVVFVIGVNEGIFPSTFNFSTASLEEERRVFYVAMTRAKERLYLTCSGGISPINKEYLSPSRFLKELGSAHVINDSNSSSRITNNDFDWFDSAKPISYADNYEEKKEEIFVGDQIVHSLFGTGVVVDKNNNFLEVIFKHPYGKKTIISNHKAILRKL